MSGNIYKLDFCFLSYHSSVVRLVFFFISQRCFTTNLILLILEINWCMMLPVISLLIIVLQRTYFWKKWGCDHHSCDCDLINRKVSPKNVFGASTGFEPMAFALALQCPTNYEDPNVGRRPICGIHRTRERNETYEYYVNCGHTNEMKMWSSQLWLRFK